MPLTPPPQLLADICEEICGSRLKREEVEEEELPPRELADAGAGGGGGGPRKELVRVMELGLGESQ